MDKFTVAQIRGLLHLSTKEMAEKLGMNPNTYGHKEEKGNWTLEEVVKIAKVSGIKASAIRV
jgi:DNA-binding XRE family transcriptional regulator